MEPNCNKKKQQLILSSSFALLLLHSAQLISAVADHSAARTLDPSASLETYVKKICDATNYPSICITQFGGGRLETNSVLETAINIMMREANLAIDSASALQAKSTTDPQIATGFHTCVSSYNEAVSNFQAAKDAIKSHDVATINMMFRSSAADVSTCRDEFGSKRNPMADYNRKITHLLDTSFEIAGLMNYRLTPNLSFFLPFLGFPSLVYFVGSSLFKGVLQVK